MPTHEQLVTTFSHWQLDVTRSTPDQLNGRVSDDDARRILTEVGIPERLGEAVTFRDFSDGPTTVADFVGDSGSPMRKQAGEFVILGSGNGILLLNGSTGEVYLWKDESLTKVNSSLEAFVDFLTRIQRELNTLDEADRSAEEIDGESVTEQLMRDFAAADDEFGDDRERYWRGTVTAAMRSMGL